MNKLFRFSVTGRGEFPLDMLRYDRCWPSKESTDVIEIKESIDFNKRPELRVISLQGISDPTIARWKSFGWVVEVISSEKL